MDRRQSSLMLPWAFISQKVQPFRILSPILLRVGCLFLKSLAISPISGLAPLNYCDVNENSQYLDFECFVSGI